MNSPWKQQRMLIHCSLKEPFLFFLLFSLSFLKTKNSLTTLNGFCLVLFFCFSIIFGFLLESRTIFRIQNKHVLAFSVIQKKLHAYVSKIKSVHNIVKEHSEVGLGLEKLTLDIYGYLISYIAHMYIRHLCF